MGSTIDETVQLPLRVFDHPVILDLSELLLTQIDLTRSLASLTLWTEHYADAPSEDIEANTIGGSLFRDGITQFVGCFDSKNRVPLVVEEVFPNMAGTGPYFRWLRSLRNSYTAHRHGAARQCAVGIMVDPETGEYLGHGRLLASYRGPAQEGRAQLLDVIRTTLNHVAVRVAELEKQLPVVARALPAEDRIKLPLASVQPQGPDGMGKSRGDIRRARGGPPNVEPPPGEPETR